MVELALTDHGWSQTFLRSGGSLHNEPLRYLSSPVRFEDTFIP